MATEAEPQGGRKNTSGPQIVRHHVGYMNKYGRGSLQAPVKEIDGVALKDLATAFGTPLYIVSEATLARRFRDAQPHSATVSEGNVCLVVQDELSQGRVRRAAPARARWPRWCRAWNTKWRGRWACRATRSFSTGR